MLPFDFFDVDSDFSDIDLAEPLPSISAPEGGCCFGYASGRVSVFSYLDFLGLGFSLIMAFFLTIGGGGDWLDELSCRLSSVWNELSSGVGPTCPSLWIALIYAASRPLLGE